mgnify:CR=1 FL=1
MIVDRTHREWILATAAIALASTLAYLVYALVAVNGPRGGSAMGLTFGFAGTGIIVFECLLGLRKKYPASPLGRVKTWLRAHVWLGLLSFLLILFHTGFGWGQGVSFLLMMLFLVITVSGVVGLALQNWIPKRMTELVQKETIYEQIPNVIDALRLEADERAEFVTAGMGIEEVPDERVLRAGGKKYYFDAAQFKSAMDKIDTVRNKRRGSPQIAVDEASVAALRAHYLKEIRPYLVPKPERAGRQLFQTQQAVAAYFERLRTILPPGAHEVLLDLEAIVEERRQLAIQVKLHRWLHGWLLVHLPLSMAFLVLTLVHAVVSLVY